MFAKNHNSKPEDKMNKNCFFVSLFVIGIVVMGMFLVANNAHDVFTSFWSLFGKLVSFSQSVK